MQSWRGDWALRSISVGAMKSFRCGVVLCQIRHGPQIMARNSVCNRNSCCVYRVYPAWDQRVYMSGILHVIGHCGPNWGILRDLVVWREQGKRQNWEVKQDTWDGFTPASIWCLSWLRESSDIFSVVSCMHAYEQQESSFQPKFSHSCHVLRTFPVYFWCELS